MVKLSAFPFGKDVVHVRDLDAKQLDGALAVSSGVGFVANVIWVPTFGLGLFVLYIFAGIFCCLTLIGIPFGMQSFKLAGISFWPVGRRVVSAELAKLVREDAAKTKLEQVRAGR